MNNIYIISWSTACLSALTHLVARRKRSPPSSSREKGRYRLRWIARKLIISGQYEP